MYLGADLSYINEVEDYGGVFYSGSQAKDPFAIFQEHGANIVRVRLWHTPDWTAFSTLSDVERTIQRAKEHGLNVLLDFHYSDTWADPAKQIIPSAWATIADDLPALETAIYEYTLETLLHLNKADLMPEFVQVGNEINTEILMPTHHNGESIRWERNARLINAGIKGVRDAAQQTHTTPQIILHIAQPEHIMWWFDAAQEAGVEDFDCIGLSYYPKWSEYSISQMGETVAQARQRYNKDLMLVEVAYPWTHELCQADTHLLGEDAVLEDYPATPHGQYDFLVSITQTLIDNGGIGVVYWEPAWISTSEKPSIWENATFFDYANHVHEGINFLKHDYNHRAQE